MFHVLNYKLLYFMINKKFPSKSKIFQKRIISFIVKVNIQKID